jgi:RNase P subunit RPR2
MISIRIAKHGVGDSSGAMLKRLPQVICADCRKAMIPSTRKRLLFAKGLEEVTYNCVFCGAAIVRSIKPDDTNEPNEK